MDGAAPARRHVGAVRLSHVDEDQVSGAHRCDATTGGEFGLAVDIHRQHVVVHAAAGDMRGRAVEPRRAEVGVYKKPGGEDRIRAGGPEIFRRCGGRHIDQFGRRLAQTLQRLHSHAEIFR